MRVLKIVGGVVVGLVSLYVVAGRSLSDLRGYVRASADGTVTQLEERLPTEVHDRKLEHELTQARQRVIDRQVQLSQSQSQIAQLRDEVAQLRKNLDIRQRLLAEAYPLLEVADREANQQVRFANVDYTLADFQREVDDLLTFQDRETKQLAIKQEGLARLEKSQREAEPALAEMRRALEGAEQEVAVLKSRRDQADVESRTLDMVAAVSAGGSTATENVGRSLDRLRTEVSKFEAENDAKRGLAPVAHRQANNRLAREWTRLESLKKYHDQAAAPGTKPATTVDLVSDEAREELK